jgi:carbon storage regulator
MEACSSQIARTGATGGARTSAERFGGIIWRATGWGERRDTRMLVLSRKKNESIVINNDITIVVVEIRGDKVRLGVDAPKEVPVHRREVYDAIRRNSHADEASPAGEAQAAEGRSVNDKDVAG